MIDIHSHGLYGVDDGARTLEESLDLFKQAQGNGITDMILTPHSWACSGAKDREWLEGKLETLRKETEAVSVQLHLGMEYAVDDYRRFIRSIDQGGAITLAGSQYVLVEAMTLNSEYEAEEMAYEMKLRGFFPILAHPERMASTHKDSTIIRAFRKAGGYSQLTLESCDPESRGMFGKIAERLLREGEADFIATDTHGAFRSCAGLADRQKRIEAAYGKTFADLLMVVNPGKVIRNEDIKKRR